MSESEGKDEAREGVEEEATDATEAAEGGNGSGGSLFKRAFSGDPQDRAVKWLVYAGGGALAAAAAVVGFRRLRRRG